MKVNEQLADNNCAAHVFNALEARSVGQVLMLLISPLCVSMLPSCVTFHVFVYAFMNILWGGITHLFY